MRSDRPPRPRIRFVSDADDKPIETEPVQKTAKRKVILEEVPLGGPECQAPRDPIEDGVRLGEAKEDDDEPQP